MHFGAKFFLVLRCIKQMRVVRGLDQL